MPAAGGGGRACPAPGRGASHACARRDLPHVCAGGGAVTRCGRRGSIMVSAGAAAAPSPYRSCGPAPALPRPACPALRGGTPRGPGGAPTPPPRGWVAVGPRAGAAALPRTGVLSPCRARGQRWGAGGTAGRRRRGAGSAARSRSPWGRSDSPGRRGGCGAGHGRGFRGCFWLRRQPVSGFLPATVTGAVPRQQRCRAGPRGHGGSLQR